MILQAITVMAREVEEYYHRPQDIEWAIDENGSLNILQSRPITTLSSGPGALPNVIVPLEFLPQSPMQ